MAGVIAIPNPKIRLGSSNTHVWMNDTLVCKWRVKVDVSATSTIVSGYIDQEQVWSNIDLLTVVFVPATGEPYTVDNVADFIHGIEAFLSLRLS